MSYLDEVNLKVLIHNDREYQRVFLESCVYEVDDAIAIVTYISYILDRENIPTYCRKWSARKIDATGLVKIRVEFERCF